jgi:two-component system, OmpR family, sensor histidine kinase KdpD
MAALTSSDLRNGLHRGRLWRGGAWPMSLAILAVSTVLAVALKPVLAGQVSSGLIFVIAITLVGATAGLVPALVCAFLAAAFFNFFLAEPELTFRMATGGDLTPPLIFTACAVVSGVLVGWLRDQTSQLGQNNLQLESLLETSRHLQEATSEDDVLAALRSTVPGKLGVDLALYRIEGSMPVPVGQDRHGPSWANVAGRALLSGGDVVTHEGLTGYLLPGSRGVAGVLVNDEAAAGRLDGAFMLALAQVIGIALERARFAVAVAEAEARERTEQLKSALLSSVSHDLRTPLTTISASASSLIEYGSRLGDDTSRSLLQGIVDECDRLNRFTANLLELSRLQTRDAGLRGQVLSVGEVARAVAQRLRSRFPGRQIRVHVPSEELLVLADTALFDLALTNVVQNALVYSESGSAVVIECGRQDDCCALTVTDQGCGIPIGEQGKVFERFYRVRRTEGQPQGSGLGLAIAKGFVEAFGGSISLTSPVRDGRGTQVSVLLPLVVETAS